MNTKTDLTSSVLGTLWPSGNKHEQADKQNADKFTIWSDFVILSELYKTEWKQK